MSIQEAEIAILRDQWLNKSPKGLAELELIIENKLADPEKEPDRLK